MVTALLRASALCLWLLLTSTSTQAEIRTFVDPKVLDETETLRLTLRLEGSRSADAPDLAPLEQDFEVLGSNSSSQYRSINGQVQSWVEYQINLRPRRNGTLTIPALQLGGEYSDATAVEVRALDPVLRQEIDRMVFFETEVNPSPVYVQAQLIFTRRLYYSTSGGVQMYSDLPGAPELADAVVIPLEDARSFAERRNDIDYGVVEQRFAIYPESSGSLTIPAVALTSSVRVLKNGRMRRSGIRVASQPVSVTVLPIPPEYPSDQPWLPATEVSVRQSANPQFELNTGSPLTHSISIEVQGNVSSAIAPVAETMDAQLQQTLRAYPKAPVTNDFIRAGTNIGRRDQTTSLLPVAPGNISLPGLEVVWWDTRNNRVRTARADAIALSIGGTAVEAASNLDEAQNRSGAAPEPEPAAEPLITKVNPLDHWRWLVLLAALLAGIGVWQQRARWPTAAQLRTRLQRRVANQLQACGIRRPGMSAKQASQTLDAALQRSAALAPAQAAAARRSALIGIVAERNNTSRQAAVALLRTSPKAAAVLKALDTQCYGNTATAPPSDESLRQALLSVRLDRSRTRADHLPPLYPER
ncbi:MAG: BatD family protein [Pseudomonadales bacterium]